MSAILEALCDDVERMLGELEPVQRDLLAAYQDKTVALRLGESDRLLELAHSEEGLAQRLKRCVVLRQQILEQVRRSGLGVSSLLQFVQTLGGSRGLELARRLQASQLRSQELQQQSWVHWILSQRLAQHCTDMLSVIANGGRERETYSHRSRGEWGEPTCPAILDASV